MRTMLSGLVNISVLSSGRSKPNSLRALTIRREFSGLEATPDIHILRCPGVAVEGNGVAADEEILDALSVEKSQELFEVWR